MRSALPFLLSFLLLFPQVSPANLRVVTDITPIYGLVAQVMAGTGTPSVILRPGSDPHHYQLRPSEAATIEQADIIFWIGLELTPWLQSAFDTLAADAKIISLIKVDGLTRLAAGKDSHAHHHEHNHGHDHEDEKGHDRHENESGHENKAEPEHSGFDPHLWLDPENARIWLQIIAQTLSLHDPENTDIYRKNALAADRKIAARQQQIAQLIATRRLFPVFAQHAAFAYFENRFGLEIAGNLYSRESEAPSPGHIAELYELTRNMPKACLLAETQLENNVIASVFSNTDLLVIEVNPSGAAKSPPLTAYEDLLARLANGLEKCSTL